MVCCATPGPAFLPPAPTARSSYAWYALLATPVPTAAAALEATAAAARLPGLAAAGAAAALGEASLPVPCCCWCEGLPSPPLVGLPLLLPPPLPLLVLCVLIAQPLPASCPTYPCPLCALTGLLLVLA
jgi:hypothetical protein